MFTFNRQSDLTPKTIDLILHVLLLKQVIYFFSKLKKKHGKK